MANNSATNHNDYFSRLSFVPNTRHFKFLGKSATPTADNKMPHDKDYAGIEWTYNQAGDMSSHFSYLTQYNQQYSTGKISASLMTKKLFYFLNCHRCSTFNCGAGCGDTKMWVKSQSTIRLPSVLPETKITIYLARHHQAIIGWVEDISDIAVPLMKYILIGKINQENSKITGIFITDTPNSNGVFIAIGNP
jgi:hypothetical protein